ncbi:ribose ABC transporter permease [Candidatus Pacearchaeota archaeon]|nr:ribose ABC transporter permease [Candidatus Pacearchaeota archaeon]
MNNLSSSNNRINRFFRNNIRHFALIGIIIILFVLFFSLSPAFRSLESFMNIIRRVMVLGIVSIGMTFVILSGGLDLSIGSNLALSGVVAAIVLNSTGNAFLGFITALAVGSFVGFINGYMIGKLKISSVVLTLATLGMARSLTLVITNASTVRISNPIFGWLGQTSIKTSLANIPVAGFLVIFLFIIFGIILNNTLFGRKIYALGSNPVASRIAGLMVEQNTIIVYVLTGLLVGVGSIVMVGRVVSAVPWAGLGLEFEAITAVIIGGTIKPGEGDLKGTFLGVLMLGILFGGLGVLDISPYFQQIAKGVLLLFAVLIYQFSQKFSPGHLR